MFRRMNSTLFLLAIFGLYAACPSPKCVAQQAERPMKEEPLEPGDVPGEQKEKGRQVEAEDRDAEDRDAGFREAGFREAGFREAGESEDFHRDSDSESQTKPQTVKVKLSKQPTLLRLPRYFSGLVDQRQRSQIQEIQLQFRSQIAQLEEELRLLKQKELESLEQVLTPSQRKLLEKKRQQRMASSVAVDLSEHTDPSADAESAN